MKRINYLTDETKKADCELTILNLEEMSKIRGGGLVPPPPPPGFE